MPGALPILLGLTLLGYLSRRRGDGVGQDADQGGPPDEGPPPDDGGGGYYQGDQGSPSMADLVAAANGGDDATIQWFRQQGRNACGIVGPPCVMDDIGLWVMPEAAPMEAPTPGYETMTFRPTWIWSDEHGGWFNRERPWERWEGHGTPPGAPRPGAPGSPGVPWHEPSGPAHGGLGVHPGWPAPHGAPPAAHGGPVLHPEPHGAPPAGHDAPPAGHSIIAHPSWQVPHGATPPSHDGTVPTFPGDHHVVEPGAGVPSHGTPPPTPSHVAHPGPTGTPSHGGPPPHVTHTGPTLPTPKKTPPKTTGPARPGQPPPVTGVPFDPRT